MFMFRKKPSQCKLFAGSLENTEYPNGLPHGGTYLGGCRH